MHQRGTAGRFGCIYHNWTYDHAGNLTHVFSQRHSRQGRHAADATQVAVAEKLRVSWSAAWCSDAFQEVASLETYIGRVLARLKRVLVRPLKVWHTQGAAEQLEALHGQREGRVPRQACCTCSSPASDQPPDAEGRRVRLARRRTCCTYTEMVEDRGDAYEEGRHAFAGRRVSPGRSRARPGRRIRRPRCDPDCRSFGVLHQIHNSLTCPPGHCRRVDRTNHWTLFGFADDDEAMTGAGCGRASSALRARRRGRFRPARRRHRRTALR